MEERPDHPHQAAVHLMRSLKCCNDCNQVSEIQIQELEELQFRREALAQELKNLNLRPNNLSHLRVEITELETLIVELRAENDEVHKIGLQKMALMSEDRQHFELEQREGILNELKAEKNLTRELTLELEGLMERVKSLNRVNNELIYNFCNY